MPEINQNRAAPACIRVPDRRLLWLALGLAYLLASASGHKAVALGIFGLIVGALIVITGYRIAGVLAGMALAAAFAHWSDSVSFLAYTPPLFVFGFMAWFFFRTLSPGIEPLITRVARREHPDLPLEMAQFTRTLTWAWSGCFAFLFLVALLLAPFLPFDSWSRWVQALGYVLPAILFLGEYASRHRRFPDRKHGSLRSLVINIVAVIQEAALKPAAPDIHGRDEREKN